jgi:sec-independent protein translocase protein TatC
VTGDPRHSGEMPFLQHLEELRKVLLQSLIGIVAGAAFGWWAAPRVMEDIVRRTVKHVIVLSPLDALNERLKLSLVIGACVALPWVVWRVWSFIVPGLFKRERTWVMPMAMASLLLFGLGAAVAYGYVVPLVVSVLNQFMTPSMTAEIRIGSLLGFVYNLSLACGVVCQLPLVCMTLTGVGLVTPGMLLKQWRYAVVLTFLVTALITPGDVVTAQIVMGIPMVALYFVSVALSWLVWRRRREPAAAVAAGPDHA